jgi:hypothetical protein
MKVFPPLTPIALSSADPGSFVIYQGLWSFVTSNQGAPTIRMLAVFNATEKRFMHVAGLPVDEQVFRVGGVVLVEPDFELGTVELRRPSSADTSTIFIRDRDVYGVLDMGVNMGPVVHVFHMGTGQLSNNTGGQAAACTAWRLGVTDTDGEAHWLVRV